MLVTAHKKYGLRAMKLRVEVFPNLIICNNCLQSPSAVTAYQLEVQNIGLSALIVFFLSGA